MIELFWGLFPGLEYIGKIHDAGGDVCALTLSHTLTLLDSTLLLVLSEDTLGLYENSLAPQHFFSKCVLIPQLADGDCGTV